MDLYFALADGTCPTVYINNGPGFSSSDARHSIDSTMVILYFLRVNFILDFERERAEFTNDYWL